jgi:succinate-acetate transporter protein
MLNVTSIKESSFRIAGPWVLGLFSLSAATFVVAARMAGWYGGPNSRFLLLPFVAVLGGLTPLLAAMWAFDVPDALGTAMLGTWGSFGIGYALLEWLFLSGRLAEPVGPYHELGFWFIPLALITWVGAAAAGSAALGLTLAFLAAGATIAAVANLSLHGGLLMAAGWLLLIASAIGWYTATAMMFEATSGRQIWPLGRMTQRVAPITEPMPGASPAARHAG